MKKEMHEGNISNTYALIEPVRNNFLMKEAGHQMGKKFHILLQWL
jgi:hypothetical protein